MAARDTIFALATPPGRAALAVIRLSGPASADALAALAGGPLRFDRTLRRRTLRDPATKEALDEALVVGFPEGEGFTGETAAEIQCHGGRAVVEAILAALSARPELRGAEPGEFARRALENGRLTLPQVEAIADLVDADTAAQRRQALEGLGGGLSRRAEAWLADLRRARSLLEAEIDFAEDEALGDGLRSEARLALETAHAAIAAEAASGGAARVVREGYRVALVGPPNVGKSSLLNALARREVAITSPIAGTTRDVLEAAVDLGGLVVVLTDMAGLREADDPLEALGVARARSRLLEADLRVFVSDPERRADLSLWREGDLEVFNKADLVRGGPCPVSAVTGEGLDDLAWAIRERARGAAESVGLGFRERHIFALREAADALRRACDAGSAEIAAEECRRAAEALEALIGKIDVEDVLGDIFAAFCIGK